MPNDAELDDWELLAQFSQVFRTVADSFMDQIDMHRAQAFLLCSLYGNDGKTQSQIAEQLSVQGATITSMLQRMEEAGLVIRRRDSDDNRLVRVYLTDAGRKKERSIHEQFGSLEGVIFEGIGQEERLLLRRMLKQMLQNLSAQT